MFGYEEELRDEIESIKTNSIPKDKIKEVLSGYFDNEFWCDCYWMGDSEASVLFGELEKMAEKLGIELPKQPNRFSK